jgi:thioredoxin-related protein
MSQIIAIFTFALLFCACKKDKVADVETPKGFIENDWEAAKALAEKQDKPIFVHFYKPNCVRCAEFKEDVLNDAAVEAFIFENYIGVFLNTKDKEGEQLAADYYLEGHPAMAISAKDGSLIKKRLGIISKEDFKKWIE